MGYSKLEWKRRFAERSDLSTYVTHLTKDGIVDGRSVTAVEVLLEILRSQTLKGSTTNTGYIVGNRPAVCFQDTPPSSLVQNLYFEEKFRNIVPAAKIRYTAEGLMVPKSKAYLAGGRPVLYEKTSIAKEFLPESEHWRIVDFDLSDEQAYVDWTHEREWRVPDSFAFDLKDVIVLLYAKTYPEFIASCQSANDDLHLKVGGIIVLDSVLL
jgi:hypothetical protein